MKTKYKDIANKINRILEVDIFSNTRERKHVEGRAAYSFILSRYYKLGCSKIRDVYKHEGKDMHHSTILYALKNWDIYLLNNKDLEHLIIDVIGDKDLTNLDAKIDYIKNKVDYLQAEQVDNLFEEVQQNFDDACNVKLK
jgi:hypothetical protein